MMVPAVCDILASKKGRLYDGTTFLPSSFLIISSTGWKTLPNPLWLLILVLPRTPMEWACVQFSKILKPVAFWWHSTALMWFYRCDLSRSFTNVWFGRLLIFIQGKRTVSYVIQEPVLIYMLFRSVSLKWSRRKERKKEVIFIFFHEIVDSCKRNDLFILPWNGWLL